ncbi:leucine-rich repeat protein [Metamycoplasma hyosynoviae]|uniref:leucine-rich repeat protein n=2 Tax=Metamycoplasma hyosynoviae TaxID=29559 RepID=UPI002365B1EB|nr:leucine-rich repeat protein [Metamycoplasma hyosynoviae]MDD7907567.1 leucine-rich repeat protein [Metamycoplasma hyosynoviae]
MKEQEQKNLNTQEPKQQNQDKVKTQNPKTKVIVWSAAGAAAAALSSIVSFSTIFSNQRKVSFLDKVLQSIKIDVKDKQIKTKDDIKTIADFVASGLNNKLYELIVETEEDQVNKQPLDKDKPYTTFRTKFAIRNKFTKAQSNYQSFEFRDIKPPKEKAELDKLGQISPDEKDRINDKVKIEFLNFNRNIKLASEVAAKDENGKFKYFNIYLKQDNNDALQYEIVNLNVRTDDEKSTAIFSYQVKVKSIDDDKFISNVLEVKFDDFAKTSTQLTKYLSQLTFSYENATQTFIQDAVQTKVIAKNNGVDLPTNYELIFIEFKTEGEHPKKIDAIVKLRDNANNIISDARSIEITGFKNYQTPEELNTYIEQIQLDVASKNTKFITDIANHSEIIWSNFEDAKYEIDLGTFLIEKLSDLTSINVHFRIKEKDGRPGVYSKQVSKTINGFKMPQELIEDLAQKITFDVTNKSNKMAYELWDKYDEIVTSNVDGRISIVGTPSVKQTDANKITVTYKVKDKNSDRESRTYSKTIEDFKTSDQNESAYSYEIIEYKGNKSAYLNGRHDLNSYIVPAKIGNYKVIKVGTLFTNVLRTSDLVGYGVVLEEGIEEINSLVVNSETKEYAQIVAISLPKTIRKITNLIVGRTTNFANLKMYDNVEEINGLFNEYKNNIPKDALYKLIFSDTTYDSVAFPLLNYFSEFFNIPGVGWWKGKGSFKLQLQESGQTPRLKINNTYKDNYTFLESQDGKTLYKVFTNNEANLDKFNSEIKYETIKKGAFTYLGIKEMELSAPNLKMSNFEWYLFEALPALKKLSFKNLHMDDLKLKYLFNDLTLEELKLPNYKNDNGENTLDALQLNVLVDKIWLPENVKIIRKFIRTFYEVMNAPQLKKLEVIGSRAFEFATEKGSHTLDFTNSPLKSIESDAFWRCYKNAVIKLPAGIQKVDKFIMYVTEKNSKYNEMKSDNESILDQIILNGFENSKLIIKESKRPSGWSKYFVGQYSSSSETSLGVDNELKIEWTP